MNSLNNNIPNPKSIDRKVQQLDPNIISIKYPHESTIPIASICLIDTLNNLYQSHYALHKVIDNFQMIDNAEQKETKYAEIGLLKFYGDDVILRLVAAAEHLANGIISMLEIGINEIKQFLNHKSNLSIVVGKYLSSRLPENPITKELLNFKEVSSWEKVIEYRDNWIHNQPPLLEGQGIVYKRRKRWIESSEKYYVTGTTIHVLIGGSDKPDYKIDEYVELIKKSYIAFYNLYVFIVDYYYNLLSKGDIKIELHNQS